jgi:hypothetical protein
VEEGLEKEEDDDDEEEDDENKGYAFIGKLLQPKPKKVKVKKPTKKSVKKEHDPILSLLKHLEGPSDEPIKKVKKVALKTKSPVKKPIVKKTE